MRQNFCIPWVIVPVTFVVFVLVCAAVDPGIHMEDLQWSPSLRYGPRFHWNWAWTQTAVPTHLHSASLFGLVETTVAVAVLLLVAAKLIKKMRWALRIAPSRIGFFG